MRDRVFGVCDRSARRRAAGFGAGLLGLVGCATVGRADPLPPAGADSEMTVNGEAGALLFVDGKASGRLPLAAPLSLPAGAHRFRIDVRGSRYESDVLMIPSGRVVELSLTRGTKGTAIAVLTLTPMIMLQLRGGGIDDSLRLALWRAAQEGARAEHAVLVPPERQQALAPRDCQADLDCQLSSAQSVDARFVLAVDLPSLASLPPAGAADSPSQRCGLRGEILDVSTAQRAAAAEASPHCVSGEDQVLESLVRMVRQLVSVATHHGRGSLSVRTTPSGAKISVAGRLRGTTPWAGPCLAGKHTLVVELDGFERFETSVDIPAAQLTSLPIELVPIPPPVAPPEPPPPAPPVVAPPPSVAAPVEVPKAPAVRPRWRFITGGALIGAGGLLGGFGVSALTQDGGCADIPARTSGVCNELYSTVGIGGSLLGFGIALAAGGALLMAWPPPASSATTRGVR